MASRMQAPGFWHAFRLVALAAVLALATVVVPSTIGPWSPPLTLAGEEDGDNEDDHSTLEGQVLGIYNPDTGESIAAIPELSGISLDVGLGLATLHVVTIDDIVPAVLLAPNAVATYGIGLGDHIRVEGDYTNVLVEGTGVERTVLVGYTVEIIAKCCPQPEGGTAEDGDDDNGDGDEDNEDSENEDEDNEDGDEADNDEEDNAA